MAFDTQDLEQMDLNISSFDLSTLIFKEIYYFIFSPSELHNKRGLIFKFGSSLCYLHVLVRVSMFHLNLTFYFQFYARLSLKLQEKQLENILIERILDDACNLPCALG